MKATDGILLKISVLKLRKLGKVFLDGLLLLLLLDACCYWGLLGFLLEDF